MPVFLHHLSLACGFLTRLVPARPASDADMAAAVRWFPAAGLLVGIVCWAPFAAGFGRGTPGIQAWAYVLLNFWVTRGLHWDGISDLADAWGSCATGDRFWTILKDSRIGAFGVMGIVIGMGGHYAGAHALLDSDRLGLLVAVPIVGRAACVALAAIVPPGERSTLGRLTCAGADGTAIVFALAASTIALLLAAGPVTLAWAAVACGGVVLGLARLARREGGINGDFMGACIVLCELAVLLAGALA